MLYLTLKSLSLKYLYLPCYCAFLSWSGGKTGGLVREELLQNNTLEMWTHQPSMEQSFFTQIAFSCKKYRVHLFVQKIYVFAICRGECESSCLYYDYYFFLIIGCLCLRRTAKLRNGCALCWQIQFGALSLAKGGWQKCWWKKRKKTLKEWELFS